METFFKNPKKYEQLESLFSEIRDIAKNKGEFIKSIDTLKSSFEDEEEGNFNNSKNNYIEGYEYYAKILRGCMKTLAMIYFCFF